MQKLIKREGTATMQQQTRAIHIVRANHRKSQMIKRNHRFIFCKGSHTVVFDDLAQRPLIAIVSSSGTLRISELSKPGVSKNFQKYLDFVLHKSS